MVSDVKAAERASHRQRNRPSASGPPFTVPAMPVGKGEYSIGTAASWNQPVAGQVQSVASIAQAAPSCPDLSRFVGRSTGSGQCVALARAVQPSLGPARTWGCGDKVQGNTALQPGTVIATFDRSNRYANAVDGSSHAAVYLSQNARGVQVLDQWAGSTAAVRTIPWNNPGSAAANTGSAFRVVKTG